MYFRVDSEFQAPALKIVDFKKRINYIPRARVCDSRVKKLYNIIKFDNCLYYINHKIRALGV